jgi:hypothetical protein
VRRHLAARHAGVDEPRGDGSLGAANVGLPEQKLAVEVGEIDVVAVDDVDVGEAGQSEILQELAAEPPCADDQDLGGVQQLCTLGAGLDSLRGGRERGDNATAAAAAASRSVRQSVRQSTANGQGNAALGTIAL